MAGSTADMAVRAACVAAAALGSTTAPAIPPLPQTPRRHSPGSRLQLPKEPRLPFPGRRGPAAPGRAPAAAMPLPRGWQGPVCSGTGRCAVRMWPPTRPGTRLVPTGGIQPQQIHLLTAAKHAFKTTGLVRA